ncbi:hypothetical protein ACIBJI_27450 [Nocardia sp. NPDC050408]|uniref:hypothetical protein n=1 Tax=Nocardia sp. NPDC050408 TaxID=3364319 RepID=UPI00379FBF52
MGYPYGQPGYGYPQPAYGYPQRASGGTAITAAVIAVIVGLLGLVGVVIGLFVAIEESNKSHEYGSYAPAAPAVPGYIYGLIALGGLIAVLWLLGAILLFRRSTAGRVILIIMSSLSLIGSAMSIATGNPAGAVVGVIPLTILICASVGSTGRWIAAARAPYPPQYPYPPAPIYAQPPQYPHY